MKNSDSVNLVLEKAKNWDSIAINIGEQIKKSDTSVFEKLTPDHKVGVFGMAIDSTQKFSSEEARAMSDVFNDMTPKQKNSLIDSLQGSEDSESMLKFLRMAAPNIDGRFLSGIDKDNLKFMSKTLQVLGKSAELKKENDLASLYLQKANYLDGITEQLPK